MEPVNEICFDDVSFLYESDMGVQQGVHHLQLTVKKGECVVLAGHSGSGKTTVTRLINGLIPDCYHGQLSGQVIVCGKNPAKEGTVGMSHFVGSVFQNPKSQFFNINSRNEMAFPLENRGVPKEDILTRIDETAEKLHMEPLVGRNMFHLSGGEKQKLAFASVSMSNQPVIVLDEPSSNLDMEAIRDLRHALEVWKAEGKTVVISEHRFFFLNGLMDRLIIFKDGAIQQALTAAEVASTPAESFYQRGLRSFHPVYAHPQPRTVVDEKPYVQLERMAFQYKYSSNGIALENLQFYKGQIVAVTGHNGAGKSTFMRCLCGLEKSCKGRVVVDGQVFTKLHKLADCCTMVMQDVNHQLFTDSVRNELLCELKKLPLSREQREVQLLENLQRYHLEAVAESHPMAISGGQKQRLAIADAALSRQNIILFDEPTSGLDYGHMKRVAQTLSELAASGKLIFLVSHDLEFLLTCCDQVMHMEQGQVIEQYPLNEAGRDRLIAWYEGMYRK